MFADGKKITEIIENFPYKGELKDMQQTDTGLINSTYILTFSDGNMDFKYILQKINTLVFKNPDELMSNIMNITGFLRNKIMLDGGNPERETLTFLYTNANAPYYKDHEGNFWRTYSFIDKCYTCDSIDEPIKANRSGAAFGRFMNLLSDYPIENLFETIPNFHNTPKRYEALAAAIDENLAGRADTVQEEIDFAFSKREDSHKLTDLIETGELPIRVTHNDTKINNVLFDKITNKAFCVIDLDTVMPGLSLYDFGDAIRSGATTAEEDEKNLGNYTLDLDLFEAYTDGYLSEAGSALTDKELDNLVFSAKLLSLECGVRFLTDYLNGDTYFKTDYPEHNLVRCRTQFKLVRDIEKKSSVLEAIVDRLRKKYCEI